MIIWGHGRRRATVGVSWPGRGDAIRERSAQSARSPSCGTRNAPAGVAVPGRPLVDRWIKLRELAHPTPRLSIGGCDESHRHVELARTRISAVPSRPRGVVVPRLERAATVVANTVRGAPVRPAPLHTTAAALGLMALLVLHVGAAGTAGAASMTARALVVSDQARRYLRLAYGALPTEFMGCMIGQVRGPVVFVQRIAPADVDPAQSTRTHVVPRETCEEAGWKGTVGMIHSHPGAERCFYFFPGTEVPSSDAESFARQPYPVDAIMCGDSIVWISRDKVQRQLLLVTASTRATPNRRPGNRVHTGSLLSAQGE